MAGKRKAESPIADSDRIPVDISETQYSRYNMNLPKSFSAYNDEGSVLYRGEVEHQADILRAEIFGLEPKAPSAALGEGRSSKGCARKRAFFLALAAVVLALALATIVIGAVPVDSIAEYAAVFNASDGENAYRYGLDQPVFAMLAELGVDVPLERRGFWFAFSLGEDRLFMPTFVFYALPTASLIYVVFATVALATAIAGLARKRRPDGTYKRARMGFSCVVMFLCVLIMIAAALGIAEIRVADLGDFFAGKGDLAAGGGLYAMAGASVVAFACACLSFGKKPKAKKSEKASAKAKADRAG